MTEVDMTKHETEDLMRFFDTVYKWVPKEYYTVLNAFPGLNTNLESYPRQLTSMQALAEYALQLASREGYSVYFRPAVLPERPKNGRGTEKDTAGSAVLYVDIDFYNVGLTKEA